MARALLGCEERSSEREDTDPTSGGARASEVTGAKHLPSRNPERLWWSCEKRSEGDCATERTSRVPAKQLGDLIAG